jgi:hypothetical protein
VLHLKQTQRQKLKRFPQGIKERSKWLYLHI